MSSIWILGSGDQRGDWEPLRAFTTREQAESVLEWMRSVGSASGFNVAEVPLATPPSGKPTPRFLSTMWILGNGEEWGHHDFVEWFWNESPGVPDHPTTLVHYADGKVWIRAMGLDQTVVASLFSSLRAEGHRLAGTPPNTSSYNTAPDQHKR